MFGNECVLIHSPKWVVSDWGPASIRIPADRKRRALQKCIEMHGLHWFRWVFYLPRPLPTATEQVSKGHAKPRETRYASMAGAYVAKARRPCGRAEKGRSADKLLGMSAQRVRASLLTWPRQVQFGWSRPTFGASQVPVDLRT